MSRLAALALAGAAFASLAHAQGTHARSALAPARERVQTADYRITGRLVRIDPNGTRTSYGLTIKAHWFPGVLRVFLDITSPVAAREHVLLEMRSDGAEAISIAKPGDHAPATLPFSAWSSGPLGEAFSYEDFLEPEHFWAAQKVLEETRRGARDCVVVQSKSGESDKTHYAEVRTWFDKGIGFPVYAEKTLRGSSAIKEFTYVGLRHNGGVWSASQVQVSLRGKPGSTLLIIDRGSARAKLGPDDFSRAAMVHFQGGL
jgi:Outer membrane lipoprotein-sorting protein